VNLSAHTQALVDLLNTAGVLTGRGKAPAGSGWAGAPGQSAFAGYAIVWTIGGKDVRSRGLDYQFDERRPQFHVRAVGADQTQADVVLDEVNAAIVATPLSVPGFDLVHLVFDTSIGDAKDDDVQPPLFYTGAYWRFWTQEQ